MNKERLEAFSDGLFSVMITIMVLELRVPFGNVSVGGVGDDVANVVNVCVKFCLWWDFLDKSSLSFGGNIAGEQCNFVG